METALGILCLVERRLRNKISSSVAIHFTPSLVASGMICSLTLPSEGHIPLGLLPKARWYNLNPSSI